jgi:hypothetical protein
MKIIPFIFFFIILFPTMGFPQSFVNKIPKYAIKFRPFSMIGYDPMIQFQGEYFLKNLNSWQFSYGFGHEQLFKNASSKKANQIRLEYKKYYKKIDMDNPWGTYFGGEFVFKKALDEKSAIRIDEIGNPSLDNIKYNVNVNVWAFHFKYGKNFNMRYVPSFEAFIGAGVRYFYNYNQGLPSGYEFCCPTMYKRLAGKGFMPSGTIGIGIGLNGWAKPETFHKSLNSSVCLVRISHLIKA